MTSQFDHLKLPRVYVQLPRKSGGGFGGYKRDDRSTHGQNLLSQIAAVTKSAKERKSSFRLDPKLIFKIKLVKESNLTDDDLAKSGLTEILHQFQ